MFVRTKEIKGKKYAYLVRNKWVDGKVKQQVKKYLGKVYSPERADETHFYEHYPSYGKRDPPEVIRDIVRLELVNHGFAILDDKTLSKADVIVDVAKCKVRTKNGKNAVLSWNDSFLHNSNFKKLVNFKIEKDEEEDTPGTRLAEAFSEAGINVDKEIFVQLYKNIYL
ncbi:MAG: hypothetical protein ABIE94_00110 [archaeon]